jgi:hypothetical protein
VAEITVMARKTTETTAGVFENTLRIGKEGEAVVASGFQARRRIEERPNASSGAETRRYRSPQ